MAAGEHRRRSGAGHPCRRRVAARTPRRGACRACLRRPTPRRHPSPASSASSRAAPKMPARMAVMTSPLVNSGHTGMLPPPRTSGRFPRRGRQSWLGWHGGRFASDGDLPGREVFPGAPSPPFDRACGGVILCRPLRGKRPLVRGGGSMPVCLRRSQTSRHATRARTRIGASCHHWRDRGGHRLGCRGVVDTPKAKPRTAGGAPDRKGW
jgi:hypothetical protein